LNDEVLDFAVFEVDLIMVGRFTEVDGTPGQVAVFDGQVVVEGYGGAGLWISSGQGSAWQILRGGLGNVTPKLQPFDDKLYVGGYLSIVGDQTGQTGVEVNRPVLDDHRTAVPLLQNISKTGEDSRGLEGALGESKRRGSSNAFML